MNPLHEGLLQRNCPLCQRDNHAAPTNLYAPDKWAMKTCTACSFVYLEQVPSYAALIDELAWERTLPAEGQRRHAAEPWRYRLAWPWKMFRTHVLRRNKIRRLVIRHVAPGPILDVGCSSGRSIARMPEQFVPFGIEISKALAAAAHARVAPRGGQVFNNNAVAGLRELPPDFFTGVTMNAFLEHETDPCGATAGAMRVLRPGGSLIVKVPNFGCFNRKVRGRRWCGFRFPDHVNYFTPATMVRLVKQAGFVITRFRFTDCLPTSDSMWLVAHKPK